jgi:hypothetical protein
VAASPPDPSNSSPLGAFAGLVGVLSIFLFFTGWVYRWAYFGFFQVDVNSLNLPTQSFFLAPIQVTMGDLSRFLWTVLLALVVLVLIKATLWLLAPLPADPSAAPSSSGPRTRFRPYLERLHRFPLWRGVRQQADFFPTPLRRDLVIVAWVLTALFWLARWQGTEDAWRDAVNRSSTRPIVTLVSPSDKIALGATLDDALIKGEGKSRDIPALNSMFKFLGDCPITETRSWF